ncbi:unnamed protein product [Lathyrus sativus]|nr:unnamed protein product [Lathyrus sativus]
MGPLLFPETNLSPTLLKPHDHQSIASKPHKSFAEALGNVCNIPFSQLLIPCVKEDIISIAIPEDEYQLGLDACKHNLHGRMIWSKGITPLTVQQIRTKLSNLLSSMDKWGITFLGKGFYEFTFSSLKDVRRV